MPTSQTILVSKPQSDAVIPTPTLVYMRTRLKHRVLSMIIKELKKAKLSQSEIARRLDMDRSQLSRRLSGPGNMTLDTISDILFAIDGLEMVTSAQDPLIERRKPPKVLRINNEGSLVPIQKQTTTSPPVGIQRYRSLKRAQSVNIPDSSLVDQAA